MILSKMNIIKKTPHLNESNKYHGTFCFIIKSIKFLKDINKLGPFGNKNFSPIFLIKNVKIIKSQIIKNKHISALLIKPKIGSSKAICHLIV